MGARSNPVSRRWAVAAARREVESDAHLRREISKRDPASLACLSTCAAESPRQGQQQAQQRQVDPPMMIATAGACCRSSDGTAKALWRASHANVSTASGCEELCRRDEMCQFYSHARAYASCVLCAGCAPATDQPKAERYASWRLRRRASRACDDEQQQGQQPARELSGDGRWIPLNSSDACAHDRAFREHCLAGGVLDPLLGATRSCTTRGSTHGCSLRHSYATRFFSPVSREAYEWVPAEAHKALPPLSSDRLSLASTAQLMIIGDSTSGQQLLALLCSLGRHAGVRSAKSTTAQRKKAPSNTSSSGSAVAGPRLLPPTAASFALASGALIQFVHSDFLVGARAVLAAAAAAVAAATNTTASAAANAAATPAAFSATLPSPELITHDQVLPPRRDDAWPRLDEAWAARLRRGPASAHDVVVFNSGLHWAGTYAYASLPRAAPDARGTAVDAKDAARAKEDLVRAAVDAYRTAVRVVLAFLSAADYRGTVHYRSNYAPGCGSEPQHGRSTLLPADAPFGWALLGLFDEVWESEGVRLLPQLRILKVSGLSGARVDRHPGSSGAPSSSSPSSRDCVHFATPGPIDVWNALLQDSMRAS